MIPTKISGMKLIKTTKDDSWEFADYLDFKPDRKSHLSITGKNNWRRYFTKRTRRYIKNETNKELNESY